MESAVRGSVTALLRMLGVARLLSGVGKENPQESPWRRCVPGAVKGEGQQRWRRGTSAAAER